MLPAVENDFTPQCSCFDRVPRVVLYSSNRVIIGFLRIIEFYIIGRYFVLPLWKIILYLLLRKDYSIFGRNYVVRKESRRKEIPCFKLKWIFVFASYYFWFFIESWIVILIIENYLLILISPSRLETNSSRIVIVTWNK